MPAHQTCHHNSLDPYGARVGCLERATITVVEEESLDGDPFIRYTRYCRSHASAHGYDLTHIAARREFKSYVVSGKNSDGSMFESIYRILSKAVDPQHDASARKAKEEAYECAREQVLVHGCRYVLIAATSKELTV